MSVPHGIDRSGVAGGTGAQSMSGSINDLADPGADRILFWDDSAGDLAFLTVGSGLLITGTTIALTGTVGDIFTLTPTDGNIIVGNGTTWVAESGATARTSLGVGTGDTPQFTGVEIGNASDTTLARVAAGRLQVETVELVRGPASATNNGIARFNSTTGGLIQDSSGTLSDGGNLSVSNGTFAGSVTVTGGQVVFPATQNAAAGANTLDDYEEGTWTAQLSNGTSNATMSDTDGRYTKVGDLVFISCDVATSSVAASSGNIQVDGLPFTSESGQSFSLAVADTGGFSITAGQSVGAAITTASTRIALYLWDATAGDTLLQASEWTDDGNASFGGCYKT